MFYFHDPSNYLSHDQEASMTEKKKDSNSKSSPGNLAFWALIIFGICYLIYQETIKPAQEAEDLLDRTLASLVFTLSLTSDLCKALEDPNLTSSQRDAILNKLQKIDEESIDKQMQFEVAINRGGSVLDKEILKLEPLASKIREQSLLSATKNSCPSGLLSPSVLEKLLKDIINRYPRTWLGILLFKLGLYKIKNINLDNYSTPTT